MPAAIRVRQVTKRFGVVQALAGVDLEVAQALVHRPPVIVLDEPTAGVDVELRLALWQFVRQLNGNGHTVVLTTHFRRLRAGR